jgi:cystathionine gamma-synthase
MSAFGGIVTLQLAGGRAAVDAFARASRLWTLAESLGGFKSLLCHPPTMTHASVEQSERERIGITEGTVRLSVGLEDARDLLADLRHALSAASVTRQAEVVR